MSELINKKFRVPEIFLMRPVINYGEGMGGGNKMGKPRVLNC